MLTITVGGQESYDETTESFVIVGGTQLQLEHSLVSLSKWEEIFEKPFLGKDPKTGEETLAYIRCMCLGGEMPPEVFQQLGETHILLINEYLNKKMTATWFSDAPGAPKTSEVVTAELIYYWMTVFNIPFECETWNLNRLFTLIRICNVKQAKPKKMSRAEAAARRQELNEQRKAQLGTSG
jgi:hypothetical protein